MIATVYEKGRLKKYFMHGPQFKDLNSIGKKSEKKLIWAWNYTFTYHHNNNCNEPGKTLW